MRSTAVGYLVRLEVFDTRGCLSGADLGSWTARTSDRALARLRLFAREGVAGMGAVAARAARSWAADCTVARQVHDTLGGGAMYVHVIADGSTFWELSARPLVLPADDEDRPCVWATAPAADGAGLTGRWAPRIPG